MNDDRRLELLAYAKVCFEHGSNPFASIHLIKKKIDADECRDLSHLIADLIDDRLHYEWKSDYLKGILKGAKEQFKETQE